MDQVTENIVVNMSMHAPTIMQGMRSTLPMAVYRALNSVAVADDSPLQIPVILGIFFNSCYDVHFNILGTAYAAVGVVITSIYQIVSVAPS